MVSVQIAQLHEDFREMTTVTRRRSDPIYILEKYFCFIIIENVKGHHKVISPKVYFFFFTTLQNLFYFGRVE